MKNYLLRWITLFLECRRAGASAKAESGINNGMSEIDFDREILEFNKGVLSAMNLLISWDIPEPEIHQGINDNIWVFLDRVVDSIREGRGISNYALGYFATLKKRNDPELNELLTAFQVRIQTLD